MPASTAGYRVIGEDAKPTPLPVAPVDEDLTSTATSRLHAMARGAGAAAVGARDAMAQLITAPNPQVIVNTEPINPSIDMHFRERMQLVWESCRSWNEFADPKAFNAPAASEVKRRIGQNVEIFFYNYLVVGFALLAVLAIFHPLRAILMALPVVAAVLMYIIFPDSYRVTDTIYIDSNIKHGIVILLSLLVLFIGHVFSLLLLFALIFVPVVTLHALLREHEPATTEVSTI